jgi:hypothetical protein
VIIQKSLEQYDNLWKHTFSKRSIVFINQTCDEDEECNGSSKPFGEVSLVVLHE